jgi:hypothetical protein
MANFDRISNLTTLTEHVTNAKRAFIEYKKTRAIAINTIHQTSGLDKGFIMELIDKDAQDSKELQKMYIEESVTRARSGDFKSYAPHLSEKFRIFFEENTDASIAALFQHEIAVQIKGRAGSSFDAYKKCPPLKYGLPVCNDADKGFVYWIYRSYEDSLRTAGQFDTDDVVISAIGQLDTPIWRRRRGIEGFDFICIDETHLFNVNEIQVFHFLTKQEGTAPISFAVDRAQAVGDRGWSDSLSELDAAVRSPAFPDVPVPLSALELLDSGLSLSLPLTSAIQQSASKNDSVRGKLFATAALRDLTKEKSHKNIRLVI